MFFGQLEVLYPLRSFERQSLRRARFSRRLRQTPISQELNTVGFYIFTVEGPQVSVDSYSADVYPVLRHKEYFITNTLTLNFFKR